MKVCTQWSTHPSTELVTMQTAANSKAEASVRAAASSTSCTRCFSHCPARSHSPCSRMDRKDVQNKVSSQSKTMTEWRHRYGGAVSFSTLPAASPPAAASGSTAPESAPRCETGTAPTSAGPAVKSQAQGLIGSAQPVKREVRCVRPPGRWCTPRPGMTPRGCSARRCTYNLSDL